MRSKSKVYFLTDSVRVSLGDQHKLSSAVEMIFKKEGFRLGSINYIFCSDEALRAINREYLSHDYYTDIITFDLSESDEIVGEIYISVDRVRENAQLHKSPIRQEFFRVIFHGALHLCGYKDKSPKEQKVMRERENFYIERFAK